MVIKITKIATKLPKELAPKIAAASAAKTSFLKLKQPKSHEIALHRASYLWPAPLFEGYLTNGPLAGNTSLFVSYFKKQKEFIDF